MKIFINDFFIKCDQIHRKLRIWSHLLKKSLMENFIFCAVKFLQRVWIIECEFLLGFVQKGPVRSLISGMSSTRACMEFDFVSIQVIESQLCLRISKILSSNLIKIFKNTWGTDFFPLSYRQLRWKWWY